MHISSNEVCIISLSYELEIVIQITMEKVKNSFIIIVMGLRDLSKPE